MSCGGFVDTRAKVCPHCGKSNPTALSGVISIFKASKAKRAKNKATKNMIECPTCGNHISPRAKSCPNCGEPF